MLLQWNRKMVKKASLVSCHMRLFASSPLSTNDFEVPPLPYQEVPNRNLFLYLCESGAELVRDVLKVKVLTASPGRVSLKVPFTRELAGNPVPLSMHGGVIAAAIDHTAGFACWSTFDDHICSTLNLRVDYLKPLLFTDRSLILDSVVEHIDNEKSLMRITVLCYDESRTKQVAVGRALFNRYQPKLGVIAKVKPLFRILWDFKILNIFGKIFLMRYQKAYMALHKRRYRRKLKKQPAFSLSAERCKFFEDETNEKRKSMLYNGLSEKEYVAVTEKEPVFGHEILGLQVLSIEAGLLKTVVSFKEYFTGNYVTGAYHGGIMASLVDQTAGMSARSVVESDEQRVSTVDFNIDYLAPAPIFECLFCEARVVNGSDDIRKRGLILVEASCWTETSTDIIGVASLTFNVYDRKR